MTVHCLFHNYSDYECSAETLIAVYLSQSDAETGLLELIARAERLHVESDAFSERFKNCHLLHRNNQLRVLGQHTLTTFRPANTKENALFEKLAEAYRNEIAKLQAEQDAWRQKELGSDFGDIPDKNLDSYSIEEIEIGKIR